MSEEVKAALDKLLAARDAVSSYGYCTGRTNDRRIESLEADMQRAAIAVSDAWRAERRNLPPAPPAGEREIATCGQCNVGRYTLFAAGEHFCDHCEVERFNAARTSLPNLYVVLMPKLREKAKECGYALTLHGSLVRDLDLVAVPWTDAAVEPAALVTALVKCSGGELIEQRQNRNPTLKPHGRLAWSIHLGRHAFIDLSVMPLSPAQPYPTCATLQAENAKLKAELEGAQRIIETYRTHACVVMVDSSLESSLAAECAMREKLVGALERIRDWPENSSAGCVAIAAAALAEAWLQTPRRAT